MFIQQYLCQKLSKSVDVHWSYSVERHCRFFETQCRSHYTLMVWPHSLLTAKLWFNWPNKRDSMQPSGWRIKADQPHTRNMLNALDYWQTDNSNGLIMVNCNYHWLNSASWVLISTCSAPQVQTGVHKQFSLSDLDLWPWPTIPG